MNAGALGLVSVLALVALVVNTLLGGGDRRHLHRESNAALCAGRLDPLARVWHTAVMRKLTSLFTCLLVFAALQVLAADPPPASTPPAASPPAASDTDAAKAAAARAKELDQTLRFRGYKPVVRNGEIVYCRKETVVGTRFTKTVCGTAQDIERTAIRSQEATEKIQNGQHQLQNN